VWQERTSPAHVATALAVKRGFPAAPLFGLMLAAQAIEFQWVLLSYVGVEHSTVDASGHLHLDYLPYSHSLLTGSGSAALANAIIRWGAGRPPLALAIARAMASHIIYDVIQHEPDIQLAPGLDQPRLGMNLAAAPALDFAVELVVSVTCWWLYRGGLWLLIAVVVLNLTNLPMMFANGSAAPLAGNRTILPTIILVQTLVCIGILWPLARPSHAQSR
jgi:hypothetical protein